MNNKAENSVQQVKNRMKTLREMKQTQLAEMEKKQAEARAQIEAAEADITKATEALDIDGYEAAKRDKSKAQTALDLYSGRIEQINRQQYVTEAESDQIIDGLLQYEKQLDTDFLEAISEPVTRLETLRKEYLDKINEAEQTIRAWTSEIHANYRSRGTRLYVDKLTGERTDRSETPIPVHVVAHTGCQEAADIRDFLDKLNRTKFSHGN